MAQPQQAIGRSSSSSRLCTSPLPAPAGKAEIGVEDNKFCYRYVVVFQYGSAVLFNIADHEAEHYLDMIRLQESCFWMASKDEKIRLKENELSARQMAVLAGLYQWIHGVARVEDESTGYILPNQALLEIDACDHWKVKKHGTTDPANTDILNNGGQQKIASATLQVSKRPTALEVLLGKPSSGGSQIYSQGFQLSSLDSMVGFSDHAAGREFGMQAAAVGGSRSGSWMRLISIFWLPSGCLCNVQTLSVCPRPPAKFSAPFVMTYDCGHPSAPTCFYGVCFYFKPNEVLYMHRLSAPLPRGRWPSPQVSVNSKCSLSIEEDSYALILPCKRKNKA